MLSPVGIASNSRKDKTPVPSSSQPGEELDNKSVCPRYCCSPGLTTLLLTLRRISSKDAYMLVYTRTPLPGSGHSSGSVSASNSLTVSVPFPPQHASKAVHAINSTHEEACKTYAEKYYLTISFYVCFAQGCGLGSGWPNIVSITVGMQLWIFIAIGTSVLSLRQVTKMQRFLM